MATIQKLARYTVSCDHCEKVFKTKSDLRRHERTHTGDKPHVCEMCLKSFAQSNTLKNHVRTHTGERPINCTTCGNSFSTPGSLQLHGRAHSGEKPFACDLCSKSFANSSNLTRHRRTTHSGEKSYICTLCTKAYTKRHALDRHLRMHFGEKPFVCAHSRRDFYSACELGKHGKTCQFNPGGNSSAHTQVCDVCHKGFTIPGSLRRHKASQHDKGPSQIPSEKCGRTFKLREHLREHEKIHSGVKQYKCSLCPWAFVQSSKLTRHIRARHTGEKPDACPAPGCNGRFSNKSEMVAHHKRVHLREEPHTCPHCPKRFAGKKDLTLHILTHTALGTGRTQLP